jgi:hypothetical protein
MSTYVGATLSGLAIILRKADGLTYGRMVSVLI